MIVTLTPLLLLCDCVSLCELELDPSFHPVKHSVKLNVCRVTLKTPVSTLRITSVLTHSTLLHTSSIELTGAQECRDLRLTSEQLTKNWPKRCWCATIPRIGMRFGHTETRTLCMIRRVWSSAGSTSPDQIRTSFPDQIGTTPHSQINHRCPRLRPRRPCRRRPRQAHRRPWLPHPHPSLASITAPE